MTILGSGDFNLSKAVRNVPPPTENDPKSIQLYVQRIAGLLTGENILKTLKETVPDRAKNYYLEFKSGTIQWVEI
jgi:hypothetical protein